MEIKRIAHRTNALTADTHANGVPYLHFPAFDALGGVRHAFSTRLGGVSKDCFASMNLSFTRGDDEADVHENYRRFAEIVGAEPKDVVCTYQTHTTNIRVVTKEDAGKGVVRERDYTDIDGLVTDDASVVLTVFYADCVPLLFADAKHHAAGTAHAGWRGTVGSIGRKMTETLGKQYGTDPSDLYVAIGPSICGDCYEVGEEVVEQVRDGLPSRLHAYITGTSYAPGAQRDCVVFRREGAPEGKYRLDLHALNRLMLEEAGIPADHIFVTDVCTKCNPELLFSYRVMGERRGNLAGFLRIAN